MSRLLDEYEAKTGIYIPVRPFPSFCLDRQLTSDYAKIHVDAASGGFVAPFASPSLKWDFRIPRVVSVRPCGVSARSIGCLLCI